MKSRYVPPAWMPGTAAITLVLTLAPGSVRAQASGESEGDRLQAGAEIRITWTDVVELVDAHPTVAAGRKQVVAARAEVDAAGAIPNPSVEGATAYGQARDSSASRVEWGLSLSIPFDWLARRGARIDAAGAEARATEAESEALRRDVLLQLRLMFWNLAYEQDRVAALTALKQETAALATTVEKRVEKGESRPVEATRVSIEAEKIAGELAMARSVLKTRQAQLGLWLGVTGKKRIIAVADLTKLPRPLSAETARAKVRGAHPAIRAAEAKVRALSSNVSTERRARIPSFSLRAFTGHELDRTAYGVGLAVDFPLWNWNTGNIRKAEALLAVGRSRLDAQRLALESSLIEAQAACQSGVALAERYRDRIQPSARSAAQTMERTYQLGEATLLEVLDARRTLLETRTQTLATLAQAQAECSRLTVLAGEELP
ncbi:MAG: TolC family protein [Polyangia bacterium]